MMLRRASIVTCLAFAAARTGHAAPFAYIAQRDLDKVTVIDTATDSVAGAFSLPAGTAPEGVAILPNGQRLYVGSTGTFNVAVASAATNTVTGSIGVFGNTIRLAANPAGTKVYGAGGSSSVKVINTATNTLGAFIVSSAAGTISFPRGVAFTPDGSLALVTNVEFQNVAVVDTGTQTVVGSVSAGYQDIAVTPDGTRAYVGTNLGDPGFLPVVGVIDIPTTTFLPAVLTTSESREIAAHPDGTRVYVSRPDGVSIIDTTTDTEVLTTTIGADDWGIDVHPDGTRVYVADPGSGNVYVLDADTLGLVTTIPVGGETFAKGRFIGPLPVCGDGIVTFPEGCDDGNTASGDCCSSTCQPETGDPCADDGLECTTDVCGATGTCTHPALAAGTPCTPDSNECSDDACDGAGTCAHPATAAGTPCSSDGSVCTTDACDGAFACSHRVPASVGCHPLTAVKTKLVMKSLADPAKDVLTFKWSGTGGTLPASLGDPTTTSDYTLCVGEDAGGAGTLRYELTAPAGDVCAGKPCWLSKSSAYPYFSYKDPELTPDGLLAVKMKLPPGKGSAAVKGKRANLGLTQAPLALPVVARLVRSDGGTCFEALYPAAATNSGGLFKASTAP